MQNPEPTGSGGANGSDWRETVRSALPAGYETLLATVDEVAQLDHALVPLLDGQEQSRDVTFYAVGTGTLHRVTGGPDQQPNPREPDAPVTSRCEYLAIPITRAATHSLAVTSTVNRYGESATLGHRWTFRIENVGTLHVDWPPEHPRSIDPVPFARALASEINRIRAGGRGV